MKRVRLIAGAAGLTPAVLGIGLPTANAAAVPAASSGKTVSLHHTDRARNGCAANVPFTLPLSLDHDVRGHGWFLKSPEGWTCIGTVVVSVFTSQAGNDCPGVIVLDDHNPVDHFQSSKSIPGQLGHWEHHSFGVHEFFHHLASVTGYSCYEPTRHGTTWFTVNNGT